MVKLLLTSFTKASQFSNIQPQQLLGFENQTIDRPSHNERPQ